MNRFDRVISILTLLHTKRVITAKELADRFAVSERTIYRDIRTLENAGVPIGSEAGVGYFLDKSYRLPPVMFEREEAVALLVAEKFVNGLSDSATGRAYERALDKIKAVLGQQDKDYINTLSKHVGVHQWRAETTSEDRWFTPIQKGIVFAYQLSIRYHSHYNDSTTLRTVEPIGLYYYSQHWHLIAWCQMRNAYRDFRLDRILELEVLNEHFNRRQRASLEEYLSSLNPSEDLTQVVIRVQRDIAALMQNQKFYYGYVSEHNVDQHWLEMHFLIAELDYFARWIISYTNGIQVVAPQALRSQMLELIAELHQVYKGS